MLLKLQTTTPKSRRKENEKWSRTLLKTVSWRVVGTLDTMLVSYILTGELTMAFSIGSIEVASKMILYFFHERLWAKIPNTP